MVQTTATEPDWPATPAPPFDSDIASALASAVACNKFASNMQCPRGQLWRILFSGFRTLDSGLWSQCVWLLFYPSLMMSVCRAKPQIATWLPARANLLQCLYLLLLWLLLLFLLWCWSLNKSKEIAFNVYLQEIKIKSIPQLYDPGKRESLASWTLQQPWEFVRLIDLDLVHCLSVQAIPFQMARS